MDIALEIVDTFVADYIYAHLFPIGSPNEADTNASTPVTEAWVWRPATKYFHVQPSQAAHMSSLARDNPYRQFFTLFFSGWIFTSIVYFVLATLLYHVTFDKRWLNHPKFRKNQIWNEIQISIQSLLVINIFVAAICVIQVRGNSKLYDTVADGPGWWYNVLQVPLLVLYIDFYNYWIHRLAHHPRVYSHFLFKHKVHHSSFIMTPYSSQAAPPIEGMLHALAYHTLSFILPFQKIIHSGLHAFHLFWIVFIHDGAFLANNRFLIGASAHSLHHKHHNCNFATISSIFDRLHGTFREPENLMFEEDRWLDGIERKMKSQRVKKFHKQ